ncbi:hypothetical protein PVAND_015022 [Polypedilum vanderplanki]|uniref:Uncharacterized protein n=1 Tax=Polypedilum vanderplanki TaxID=319348 RepID=A0A9J6BB10_POLVA|nr:hypothetical protein PVAND_015022 [Polypedilum vanderplanki]
MINQKLSILFIIITITSSFTLSQTIYIKGTIQHTRWKEFNATLWTFHVHPKTEIYDPSSEIFTTFNERISAITMQDQKKIQSLPVKIASKFPNLKIYEAYNCSVMEVAKENFEKLVHLRAIDLQYNELIAVPETAFADQINLVFLNLAHNKILRIYEKAFENLKSLRMLYLGWNQIEILPKNLLRNMPNLRKIGLTSNNLKRISNEHFQGNNRLTYIWLNENKIEVIEDEKIFDSTKESLKSVDMELNRCINKIYSSNELGSLSKDIKRNCKKR